MDDQVSPIWKSASKQSNNEWGCPSGWTSPKSEWNWQEAQRWIREINNIEADRHLRGSEDEWWATREYYSVVDRRAAVEKA